MLSITNLKTGVYFEYEKEPYQVISYEHSKHARQAGIMRINAKNLISGAIKRITFKANMKVAECSIAFTKAQYLYESGNDYFFMNSDTYENFSIKKNVLEYVNMFLIEGSEYIIQVWDDKPIDIKIPDVLDLEVLEAEPGVKGDTATSATKLAKLSDKFSLQVPLFINQGDIIRVDTKTKAYIERVKR